jgi:hypothetical protein
MVTKKSPSIATLATGDSPPPRRLVRAVVTHATAPTVVADAAAGAAMPIPHASAAAPPLSKPSGAGKKSVEDAVPAEEETATAPTVVAAAAAGAAATIPHASAAPPPLSKPSGAGKKSAEDAAGAPPAIAKPKGSTGKKSLRKTVPAEEETQLKKKKVGPLTFILGGPAHSFPPFFYFWRAALFFANTKKQTDAKQIESGFLLVVF